MRKPLMNPDDVLWDMPQTNRKNGTFTHTMSLTGPERDALEMMMRTRLNQRAHAEGFITAPSYQLEDWQDCHNQWQLYALGIAAQGSIDFFVALTDCLHWANNVPVLPPKLKAGKPYDVRMPPTPKEKQ